MNNQEETNKFFRFKCNKGLKKLDFDKNQVYVDRLKYEIGVIEKMEFPSYFLIVADVINWAKANNIPVGPGRGSCAGSLVAYVLGITQIDSIKYDLLFERFLNPDRIAMPDIDLDFSDIGRDAVLDYVTNKYGKDHVASMATYGTLKCRAAIKAVARGLGATYEVGDKLSKLTPEPVDGKMPKLSKCYESVPELHAWHSNDKTIEGLVLNWADKVEDRIDHSGTHPSGYIIGNKPLNQLVPLQVDKEGRISSQWDMNEVEKAGLVKFDFLGLTALNVIAVCIRSIKQRHGVDIDISAIPQDDPIVFKRLQSGDAQGIFQIETSSGIRDLMIKIKPKSIEDLGALVSVYRPGPLCLSGDTLILQSIYKHFLHKGSDKLKIQNKYVTIKSFYEEFINENEDCKSAVSLNLSNNKLKNCKIKQIIKSGIKKVYKINIQLGLDKVQTKYQTSKAKPTRKTACIKSTLDHKFLTFDRGWQTLNNLNHGDYICIKHHGHFGVHRSKKNIYGKKNFHQIASRHYVYKCCFCDWNKGKLDVNHIEGNRFIDNSGDNLSFLCPNHHRMYSEGSITKQELLAAREQYVLPFTDEIMYVKYLGCEFAGEEETYDIEMDDEDHNFIAGDFIVHNSSKEMHTWLNVRAGMEDPHYLVPELKPILSVTDGFLIYQEQCMKMAVDLAGYTLSEADNLRKSIGKKLPEEMAKHEIKFKAGMQNKGFKSSIADNLWTAIKAFAAYGFNKSHGIAYGLLAYQTAYLKAHYPIEYMCALLSCKTGNEDQVIKYIFNCRELDIKVLPPDINKSHTDFSIDEDGHIRFGLAAVKNLGEGIVETLINIRGKQPYKDLMDFIQRVDTGKINRRKLDSLILAGAFDYTEITRAAMLQVTEDFVEFKKNLKAFEAKAQTYDKKLEAYKARLTQIKLDEVGNKKSKFKPFKLPEKPEEPTYPIIKDIIELSEKEILKNEKELLGFYVSGHPVTKFLPIITADKNLTTIEQIKSMGENNNQITLIAVPCSVDERTTKKTGKKMANMLLEDCTGSIHATAFPKTWEQFHIQLQAGEPLLLKCKVSIVDTGDDINSQQAELLIGSVNSLNHIKMNQDTIDLQLELNHDKIIAVHKLLEQYAGDETKVRLTFISADNTQFVNGKIFSIRNRDLFVKQFAIIS